LVRLVLVPDQSKARYRVREQLAGVSLPDDAVGATQSFTGTIVGRLDGTIVSDQSLFQVDLRTLKSDGAVRDNFISRNVLETGLFPYATFVPTSAPGLPLALPPSGDLAFKLVGNLTIRNVTKPVTWDVKGQVVGTTAVGQASTDFTFEDFNLTQPRVGRVLSIVDSIRLELDLTLGRE
jgi:polyisoprenoid-binding protein YceI